MEFNFNLKDFIESAEQLGIEIELNSDNPGMFYTDGETEVEITFEELFPEVFQITEEEDNFSFHGLPVNIESNDSSIIIVNSPKIYKLNPQMNKAA